ncbi:MAG: hypothetical protein ACM3UP_02590, partial [Methanocella sp.]
MLVAIFTAGQPHDGDDAAPLGSGPHAGFDPVEQAAALERVEGSAKPVFETTRHRPAPRGWGRP